MLCTLYYIVFLSYLNYVWIFILTIYFKVFGLLYCLFHFYFNYVILLFTTWLELSIYNYFKYFIDFMILRFYDSSLRSEFILYILCCVKKTILTVLIPTTFFSNNFIFIRFITTTLPLFLLLTLAVALAFKCASLCPFASTIISNFFFLNSISITFFNNNFNFIRFVNNTIASPSLRTFRFINIYNFFFYLHWLVSLSISLDKSCNYTPFFMILYSHYSSLLSQCYVIARLFMLFYNPRLRYPACLFINH